MREVTELKTNRGLFPAAPVSEKEARLVSEIRRLVDGGSAVEVRRVDDGYYVMEVRKKRKLVI